MLPVKSQQLKRIKKEKVLIYERHDMRTIDTENIVTRGVGPKAVKFANLQNHSVNLQ